MDRKERRVRTRSLEKDHSLPVASIKCDGGHIAGRGYIPIRGSRTMAAQFIPFLTDNGSQLGLCVRNRPSYTVGFGLLSWLHTGPSRRQIKAGWRRCSKHWWTDSVAVRRRWKNSRSAPAPRCTWRTCPRLVHGLIGDRIGQVQSAVHLTVGVLHTSKLYFLCLFNVIMA